MPVARRNLLAGAAAAALARPAIVRAQQLGAPVRIGEINSYATEPAFAEPYRKGWQMALDRVNDLGGINGRKLEMVARDDGGRPENAVRLANELVQDKKVDVLAGGYGSEAGLAISAFALQHKRLYVAGEPLTDALVWEKGNRFTFRIRPSTFELAAMLVESALALPAKTWVTVAPDSEYGRSAVKWFRQLLAARRPDIRFVGEQWPAPGRVDARAVASALAGPAPDAVFNALTGSDLVALVREGSGLFTGRVVASMLTGEPEELDALGNDTPPGWIVTGYPWAQSDAPDNKQFVADYTARYHEPPRMASVLGVALVNAIASGVMKAGGTDPEAMASGFADAAFNSPFGLCRFRAVDHQSTLGTYVGKLAKVDGKGIMTDWRYVDGGTVLPPDSVVRQLRPS